MEYYKEILDFIKLAKNRFKSDEQYIMFQRQQGRLVIDDLSKRIKLDGLFLDLGCCMGGCTIELQKKAKEVYALDFNH